MAVLGLVAAPVVAGRRMGPGRGPKIRKAKNPKGSAPWIMQISASCSRDAFAVVGWAAAAVAAVVVAGP